jgi:cell division protein FtsB
MRQTAKPSDQTSRLRALLRWPAFLVANIALFILVGVSTARETYRGWSVDHEIQTLKSQAEALEDRKLKLAELANSISSPEQVELEARTRLGWKKPGEQVVVLTGYEPSKGLSAPDMVSLPPEPEPVSIQRQWFNYFFHPKK